MKANILIFPIENIPRENNPSPCEFVILNSGPSNTTLRNSDDVVISSRREYNIKPDTREQSLHLDWMKKFDDLSFYLG